jgi:hypothetical protein
VFQGPASSAKNAGAAGETYSFSRAPANASATATFRLVDAVCVQSVFKCPPTGIGDPDTADKLAAGLLALNCYKTGTDEAR